MAEDSLERELQCAICTDILYQPLTLLNCLHTFCGSCLKEWFEWQARSAAHDRRSTATCTCPSCRESVRGTRVDHRANTLLEMYLKANPGKGKTEEEKEEMRQLYSPGDDVLKDPQRQINEQDVEDERVVRQVQQLSLAEVGAGSSARREERSRDRRRRHEGTSGQQRSTHPHLAESRLRQQDRSAPQVEHQPSLRSLLSASDADDHDVQAEILRSIYAEGVLDGLDLDNLTPEQEEQLTDRIAQAYFRRQQQQARERSQNWEQRQRGSRSPQASPRTTPGATQSSAGAAQPSTQSRPTVPREHVFNQGLQEPFRTRRRSPSSTSQRSTRSAARSDGIDPAGRSATDLSQQPSVEDSQRSRHSRQASSNRSVTDPETGGRREEIHRMRAESNRERQPDRSNTLQNSTAQRPQPSPTVSTDQNRTSTALRNMPPSAPTEQHSVRPAMSVAAFAPELVSSSSSNVPHTPNVSCSRCGKASIQNELHYNCSRCNGGNFSICHLCYRNEQGCNYWFGVGFRAKDRWYRNAPSEGWPQGSEEPHVLQARRYISQGGIAQLQEGAFCESCFEYANDCYWWCTDYCLEGAWGYCDNCVKQGRNCTHPLLLTSHVQFLQQPHYDPTKSYMADLPHMPYGSFATLPPTTHCDICHRPIPPSTSRYHCYQCSEGDYDICTECYRGLVAQGKISQGNGPDGWRRCLNGHRMAVVEYLDRQEGGHVRQTRSEMVGGWHFKEDEASRNGQMPLNGQYPPSGGTGSRALARYSYFPVEGADDELAFPKNAELREVKDVQNDDWYLGVYAGRVDLIPRNYVRML